MIMTEKQGNNQKLEGKLVESIKIKGLGELLESAAEYGIDIITDNEAIKAVPIVGTLVQLTKGVFSVRNRLYVLKVVRFLQQVADTKQEQREAFIEKYCGNTKRFEEAVLLILEQVDNINKSALIGKIFKGCILGMISYQNALSLSCIINKALWQDIENMLQRNFTVEMKMRLCNCGLLNLGWMRRIHEDHTKKPAETKETFDGFNYQENEYFKMLMKIAEL